MRVVVVALASAAFAGAVGCVDQVPAPPPPVPVTSVTFNIAGGLIDDPVAGPQIADQLAALHPDFAELEECHCDELLARMPPSYKVVDGSEVSEVGILYDGDRWEELDSGVLVFGNDDNWGTRAARWARLQYRGTDAEIYVYATHLCVPIRTADDACDTDRQVAYAREIADDIESRNAVSLFGGDLNVFDGFEDGPVIQYLEGRGLVDTLRQVTQDPVTTFVGNDWAPPGRIDYVFATPTAHVLAAAVAPDSASDHRPVSATVQFQ